MLRFCERRHVDLAEETATAAVGLMLLARLFLLSRANRAQEALRFVNYVACLGLCDYRQFGDQHIFGRAAGPSVRQSSVRVNAIGHELLPLSKDLDLALCAIRQKELRGLKLGERVLGLIDEEELRWPADANERRRAEADLDQADELVDDLLVQDVDVETNDLAAQHSRIECASIWGNFRCRWRILAGQLAPLPARLLARVLERFSVVIDPLIGIPHFERPISVRPIPATAGEYDVGGAIASHGAASASASARVP
jgi:hypothetical protein